MPILKIERICSTSSEDANQPAENLLGLETYKKWACATAGETSAVVVLQLDKSSTIHALDVGNHGSAFIEVLVGRSTLPDSFRAFLGMSTFMSVSESKAWANANQVRMFGKEHFCKEAAAQKWDRVKVVCTQPYNKNEKYGLAFIKLHAPPEATPSATPTSPDSSVPTRLGKFSLKEEMQSLPPGSLFFRRNTTPPAQSNPAPSIAAQARMASAAALRVQAPPTTSQRKDSPKNSHRTTPSDSAGGGDRKRTTPSDSGGGDRKRTTPSDSGRGDRKRTTPSDSGGGDRKRTTLPQHGPIPVAKKPRVTSERPAPSSNGGVDKTPLPLSQLMRGVMFTLSGFKNPFRSQLRAKALEMGALYQADWNPECTHLVCAFPNTPKFDQVKGEEGMIVRKEWILDSHMRRRRLPAKKYRLSSGDAETSSEAEDERYDVEEAKIFRSAADSKDRGGGQGSTGMDEVGSSMEGQMSPVVVASLDEEAIGQGSRLEGQRSPVGVRKEMNEEAIGQGSRVGVAKEDCSMYAEVIGQGSPVGVAKEDRYSTSEAVVQRSPVVAAKLSMDEEVQEQDGGQRSPVERADPYDASTDEDEEVEPLQLISSHGATVKGKPFPADEVKSKPLPADEVKSKPRPADEVKSKPLPADEVKSKPRPADEVKSKPLPDDEVKSKPLTDDEPMEDVERTGQEKDGVGEQHDDVAGTPLDSLPVFLSGCCCFLYGGFSQADCRMLARYVIAYGGEAEDYMGAKVTHVITLEDWDANFDQALCENSSLVFVRPQWIFACHQKQQCVPCLPYALTHDR